MDFFSAQLIIFVEESIYQQGDVFFSVSQRRKNEFDHIDPVVQIFPEQIFFYQILQVLIGGRDDADVGFFGFC